MCDIQAALAVAGAVQSHREKKAQNKAIRRDQDTARRNFDRGYLHDLNKIDQETVGAEIEKSTAERKSKAEKDAEIAQKINLGYGNNTKLVQSIGYLFDDDWNEITSGYEKDNQMFANQKTEAYANLQKSYNSLTPPTDPSMGSLLINMGSEGYAGYQRNETNKKAKEK